MKWRHQVSISHEGRSVYVQTVVHIACLCIDDKVVFMPKCVFWAQWKWDRSKNALRNLVSLVYKCVYQGACMRLFVLWVFCLGIFVCMCVRGGGGIYDW